MFKKHSGESGSGDGGSSSGNGDSSANTVKTCNSTKNSVKRVPMIAGNWKMNKTIVEAVDLAQKLSYEFDDKSFNAAEIVLCPPFVDLQSVRGVLDLDKSCIKLGAQDAHYKDSGAYTGCISAKMLAALKCDYCIIGHSERRQYFHETDEDINKKAAALFAHGITPIMCCGESLDVRDSGKALEFVTSQVRAGLNGLAPENIKKIVIAYEPIWAIGTDRTATPEQAQEVCFAIRETVASIADEQAANSVRILYGGSMKAANVATFMPMPDIDGGLIGGASLDAKEFRDLIYGAAK